MTAENPIDFAYEHMTEPASPDVRRGYWRLAAGLQEVDGLETSAFLATVAERHSVGEYSIGEAGAILRAYYAEEKSAASSGDMRGVNNSNEQQEADLVSHRIVELLEARAFFLAPEVMGHIHRSLFQDLDPEMYRPGIYKTEALVKRELILNGDSVLYGDPSLVKPSLAFLFEKESRVFYGADFDEEQAQHFAQFIAHLWQVHPLVEGNTRTVATFAILYLDSLGFDAENRPFEQHSRYFRDALVRANYRNAKAKILPDLQYLVRFFENLICGAQHKLQSHDLICRPLFDNPSLLRNIDPSQAIEQQR